MGEYAIRKSDGERIKIGTCENMYYLRYEDRNNIEYSGNFMNYRFRLPFPDEDSILIGEYEEYDRGIWLYKSELTPSRRWEGVMESKTIPFELNGEDNVGNIQLHHKCGMLLNIACSHGKKLPAETDEIKAGWNGKASIDIELKFIKYTESGLKAIVGCRWCSSKWITDIQDIIEFIPDEVLRNRIEEYTKQ